MPLRTGPTRTPGADLPARRRTRTGAPVAYDFRRPPVRISPEHAQILRLALSGFAREAQATLTSTLRTACQADLVSVEQRSYAQYTEALPATTYLAVFTAAPIPGAGVLQLPLAAAMACIDHMLGGPGGPNQPIRALTAIESDVIRGLVDQLLAGLRGSLLSVVATQPVLRGVDYSPRSGTVAAASDVVVVATLKLRLGESAHQLTLCLPYPGLLPHLVRTASRSTPPDRDEPQRRRASEQMHAQLLDVPVEVTVSLRPTSLTPAEIGGLRVGDIVRLPHPASAPLNVTAAERTLAHATAGTHGRRLAALVVAVPDTKPKEPR